MLSLILAAVTAFSPIAEASRAPAPAPVAVQVADETAMVTRALRSGALTQREAQTLRADIRQIATLKRSALKDGRVSYWERARISSAEREFRRDFSRLTHNRARR